ncbi:di-N-acetylchitobiase isoform X1 [Lethenteron reissneri]|uniref:di-N-acetylchitobiase isoform X1 n=1 Tax=Lethenteron reissneri TaxID=7753 RepID=UPI002AB7534D|nr:di-N-acetylchitobiase isoform X1 [Lethenteron reissneri]
MESRCAPPPLLLLLLPLLLLLRAAGGEERGAACPCPVQTLCLPPSLTPAYEVYVFHVGGKDWMLYDWTKVTTVAIFSGFDAELMCYAHSKGARVVLKGDVDVQSVVEPAARARWVQQQVVLAQSHFMDGINLDIEAAVGNSSAARAALTALARETTAAFHSQIPGSQVTFDVAWSPDCIDGRCYDYPAIAEAVDFLFVMSYDMQSQIWEDCIAMANAPYVKTVQGYEKYIYLGIAPAKLVMGIPWYGYDYPCLNLSEHAVCSIPKVPFRGAPCSDAAGKQIAYKRIVRMLNESHTVPQWDDKQKAPYFTYKNRKGAIHQLWYDDPKSLAIKAAYGRSRGLRGIGMWNGDLLDYSQDPLCQNQTQEMWAVL